jgi:hypothetical protein
MSEALTFADVERIVRAMAAVGIFLRTLRRIGGDLVLTTDNCAGAFEDLAAAETPALYAAMRHELDSLDRANAEYDAARDPYHAVARVLRRHGRAADGTTEDSTTFWAARWDGPRGAGRRVAHADPRLRVGGRRHRPSRQRPRTLASRSPAW